MDILSLISQNVSFLSEYIAPCCNYSVPDYSQSLTCQSSSSLTITYYPVTDLPVTIQPITDVPMELNFCIVGETFDMHVFFICVSTFKPKN